MKKRTLLVLLLTGWLLAPSGWTVAAQDSILHPAPKIRIALFAPFYLDSAFNGNNEYRYPARQFPKQSIAGLEFYEGAMLALDTLNKEGAPIELVVFDNKSSKKTIQEQLNSPACSEIDLILTYCSAAELKFFATVGKERMIPVINVNLPNDGGVSQNPYLVLLNSTLSSQCQSIYHYIRNKFSKQRLIVFQKKGPLETRIRAQIEDAALKSGNAINSVKFVELSDSFSTKQLTPWIDTTQSTLCWVGSLDENFGKRISLQLAGLAKQRYKVTVMGMPTWDGIREFSKKEYQGIDILYCTPFYSSRNDTITNAIEAFFNEQLYARPSDMVLRGYEAMWRFSKLLLQYPMDMFPYIGSNEYNPFRQTDIKPVRPADQSTVISYYENKKLYYLKWQEGVLKLVN